MKELISVIVPIYNVEKYLCRCIESIRNQTYEKLEILMIDNGSMDQCPEICDEYAAKDARIRVVHIKKNGGLPYARNVGLDIARGNYIFFVDSDDYIDGNAFSIMLKRLHESNADIAVCDYAYVDEKGERIEQNDSEYWPDGLLSGKQFLARSQFEEKTTVVVWNKLYKREIFEKLRFDLGKMHEDEFIFHKVCDRCDTVVVVGKVLYFYTQRNDSLMGNYDYNFGVDAIEAYLNRILYMKSIQDEEVKKACSDTINTLIYLAIKYSRVLGFNNSKLNTQMKNLRTQVLQFLPVLFCDESLRLKEKIAFSIWLFSPKIYGIIRRQGKSEP